MTHPDPDAQRDAALDALIRDASTEEANEAATARAVLARIARPPLLARLTDALAALDLRAAGVGFAALTFAAGLGGYLLVDLVASPEELLWLGLALGDVGPDGLPDAILLGGDRG